MHLSKYLEKNKITVVSFADRCGWSFSKTYRLSLGEPCTFMSAYIINLMTDGEVTFEDLLTAEQRKEIKSKFNYPKSENKTA